MFTGAMKLADLIDLEAQLARDRDADPAALDARDGGSLPSVVADRGQMLRRWLELRRNAGPGQSFPGAAVASALRTVRAALIVLGLVLGWGAATAVLHYTGEQPVNAWEFLLVFVGVQLLLFVLLLASFFLPVAALGTPLLGLFRGILAWVYPRLAARAERGAADRLAEWRTLWHRLRSRRSLYHHLEPWLLLGLTQAFGVAFNLGALLGCLRLIVFSDIAFSWSTTLVQLDAARFHALVHALAAPFAWLWPEADPSPALVEVTRYSRLAGTYVLSGVGRSARPELVGGWWPFLLSALVFYGLLPRLLTLTIAQLRVRRLLSRLPLDDAEVSRLVRRIAEPRVETRSTTAEPPLPSLGSVPTIPMPAGSHDRCTVVLWRDVPQGAALEEAIARQTRWPVAAVHPAGGRDYEEGSIDWARLVNGKGPVVVVAEGWEAPDKAVLRLMRELRRAVGEGRHLVVLLADVEAARVRPSLAQDVRIWQEGLAPLEDPYLAVQPLRGAP
jgi:hypothetical protein